MKLHHRILLPHLVAAALLLISGLLFAYDAHTVLEAEEVEEDLSGLLVLSGNFVNSLQRTQLFWLEHRQSRSQDSLQRFRQESDHSANRLQALQGLVIKDFAQATTLLQPLPELHRQFVQGLDGEAAPQALFRIQLMLDQLESDIRERRQELNGQVALSVRRAAISIGVVIVMLIAILALSYTVVVRALARNRQLRLQLEDEATHDTLTQLPNRRYFLDWIARSTAGAGRAQACVALLYLDLDGFKSVNDRWGHAAGDEVLRVASRRLQAAIRESDRLFRLGGDEFALVVNHAGSHDQLMALAARLLDCVALPIALGADEAHIGVSIGVALYPQDAPDHVGLLKAADDAMYHAKQAGKNRYCFHADQCNAR